MSDFFINSFNFRYYEFISGSFDYAAAKSAAEARTYNGMKGYLATITSAQEQAICFALLTGATVDAWIGLANASTWPTANFQWQGGPELNQPLGPYTNWTPGEPNGSAPPVRMIRTTGQWADTLGTNVMGYLVEYGGL